jgi:hypothetical protein
MNSKPVRLSRRTILVAIGLTPAILVSLKASANDYDQIVAWAKDPKNHVPDDPIVRAKFVIACGHLWNACVFAMGGPEMMPEPSAVLAEALNKSAIPIRNQLDKFPADGYDERTMGCGGICGYFCAQEAQQKAAVTPEVFDKAWQRAYDYFHPNGRAGSGLAC